VQLPFAALPALAAPRPASSGIPVSKPSHDELSQIARSVPLAFWTPAAKQVPMLEDLAEGPDFDALHGQSISAPSR